MSILSAIIIAAGNVRRAHLRYRTERELLSLPLDIQKDIGWAVSQPSRNEQPRP